MIHKAMRISVCLAGLALIAAVFPATAQVPDEFTNLKVLPEDIGKRELMSLMREFSLALGERCDFCHAEKQGADGMDFASDELKHKEVARGMMRMTHEINDKLVPAAGLRSPTRVRCVTCHRGVEKPETLDRILLEVAEKKGATSAVERYGEIREKYYGSGSYDFGAGTLNAVAEKLAQEGGDLDGALELAKLNVQQHPDSTEALTLQGQIHARKGDKEAAISSLEKALELDPSNRWAQQILERVRSPE